MNETLQDRILEIYRKLLKLTTNGMESMHESYKVMRYPVYMLNIETKSQYEITSSGSYYHAFFKDTAGIALAITGAL